MNEADIIVLGSDDSRKIVVEKKEKTTPPQGWMDPGWKVNYWAAWLGSGGKLKIFGEGYKAGAADEYLAVAEFYAGMRSEINARNFADGVEFTYSLIPFGSAWIKVSEGKYAEAGVLFVTDGAMLVMPLAKLAHASGKMSAKSLQEAVTIAKDAGYKAAAIQTGLVADQIINEKGLTLETSGELLGILLNVGAIKMSSLDATKAVAAGANGLTPGTKLKTVDLKALEQTTEDALDKVSKKVKGEIDIPEPLVPQHIDTGPNHGNWQLKDTAGNPVGPPGGFDTLDKAKAAADRIVKATLGPNGAVGEIDIGAVSRLLHYADEMRSVLSSQIGGLGSRFRKGGGNIAVSELQIGDEIVRVPAFSGTKDISGFAPYVKNSDRILGAGGAGSGTRNFLRDVDAEAKILERMLSLTTSETRGTLRLFSELPLYLFPV